MAEAKKIIEYQTRSDNYTGTLLFKTFDDAYAAYQRDPTIWKISFGDYRWVKKLNFERWSDISEKKLRRMSKDYLEDKSEIYWVHQTIQPDNYNIQWKNRMNLVEQDEWVGDQYYADCIKEILTDNEFRKKFTEQILAN